MSREKNILLLGVGRSGTSYVYTLFNKHPNIKGVCEPYHLSSRCPIDHPPKCPSYDQFRSCSDITSTILKGHELDTEAANKTGSKFMVAKLIRYLDVESIKMFSKRYTILAITRHPYAVMTSRIKNNFPAADFNMEISLNKVRSFRIGTSKHHEFMAEYICRTMNNFHYLKNEGIIDLLYKYEDLADPAMRASSVSNLFHSLGIPMDSLILDWLNGKMKHSLDRHAVNKDFQLVQQVWKNSLLKSSKELINKNALGTHIANQYNLGRE